MMSFSFFRRLAFILAAFALVASACGDDDTAGPDNEPAADDSVSAGEDPEPTEAPAVEPEETDTEPGEEPEAAAAPSSAVDFAAMGAPSGEAIVIGFSNIEGPAGLNFPEIEEAVRDSVDYLNAHGGLGDRPIQLEVCIADGSPERSQACAQELAGKGVEMVWIGLDLFPDYPTFAAEGIPVVGMLPLFPADYASDAIFVNGGNAALAGANVFLAKEFFNAEKVAIISADNPGANGSEAAVKAALDKAGIEYRSIKGAETETDAGAQGLVREALSDEPDLLISLYGDAGCIGMIRGREALGSDVPVLSAGTCTNEDVLEATGDDSNGWYYVSGGEGEDTPQSLVVKEALFPGEDPANVSVGSLGLGALSPTMVFTVAAAANDLAATGGEITGQGIADHIKANPGDAIALFPDGLPLACAAAPAYPSVCNWSNFMGEYVGDGNVVIVDGYLNFDVVDFVP